MKLQDLLLISLALLLMVFGQIMSKIGSASSTLFNVFVLLGYVALLLRGLVWILVLKKLPISFAYPVMSLSFVLILLASHYIFDEPITGFKVLGSLLLIIGVLLTSLGKKAGEGR